MMTTLWFVIRHLGRALDRALSRLDDLCLRGHAEVEMFPSDEARKASLDRIAVQIVQSGRFWLTMTLVAGSFLAASVSAAAHLRSVIGVNVTIPPMASLLVAMAGGLLVANCWIRQCVPVMLRAELLSCGVPICVGCGYSLKGTYGSGCPECGRSRDTVVHAVSEEETRRRDMQLLAQMNRQSTQSPFARQQELRSRVPAPASTSASRTPGVSGREFARRCLEPWPFSPGSPRTYAMCS